MMPTVYCLPRYGVTFAVRLLAEPVQPCCSGDFDKVIHRHFRRVPGRCSEDGDNHDRWFTTVYIVVIVFLSRLYCSLTMVALNCK
jgi:hypothetical protein